ncbi:MAG: tRNA (adenosine(37)-N6)-dimethylallyltransferase MiaA [Endomicrobium sp.]|jgi:tRNA dimethylallyltransferase|nr:tRNA (adenosine(37)-N6)-dimethylallyltransferase MiaA [Endomicrobium sp.]
MNKNIEIIIISGPTASGKTKKAVEICKKNNGEIISCDSRQIYKYLNIGLNKSGILLKNGLREIDGVLQHLTDIINPDQCYSVANFINDADSKIIDIIKKNKVPVITGGTGLYIKSLIYGIDKLPKTNEILRNKLKSKSYVELYDKLLKLDPESAEKNKKNPYRLLRALEINILSGKTLSMNFRPKSPRYKFRHYSIFIERKKLYDKINERCNNMIKNGMIEETREILNMGFKENCYALSNAIGYKYILQFLKRKISLNDLIIKFSRDTRNYAKRQITWFNAQPGVKFINGK